MPLVHPRRGFRLRPQTPQGPTALAEGSVPCTGHPASARTSEPTGNALSRSGCSSPPQPIRVQPSDPRAAPAGLGREQGRGGGSVGASQGETALSPPRARCSQGLSVPSRSHLNHTAARGETHSGRPVRVRSSRAPEAAPLLGEVVLDAALSSQTAGAFPGQASFGGRRGRV